MAEIGSSQVALIDELGALPAVSIPNSFLCVATSPGPNLGVACSARRAFRHRASVSSDRLPHLFTFALLSLQPVFG